MGPPANRLDQNYITHWPPSAQVVSARRRPKRVIPISTISSAPSSPLRRWKLGLDDPGYLAVLYGPGTFGESLFSSLICRGYRSLLRKHLISERRAVYGAHFLGIFRLVPRGVLSYSVHRYGALLIPLLISGDR